MKIGILFSGQGDVPGANARALWQRPAAAGIWAEACDILGEDIVAWLDDDLSHDTRRGQLVSVVGSIATFAVYMDQIGVAPHVILGHSVGEVAALSVAGGWPLDVTVHIANARSTAMQRVVDTGDDMAMAAILNPPFDFSDLLVNHLGVWLANLNGPSQVVVSGLKEAVQSVVKESGVHAVTLPIPAACHTPLMDPAAQEFAEAVSSISLDSTPGPTVVMNSDAHPLTDWSGLVERMAYQMTHPVLWQDSVEEAARLGAQVFIDLSPGGKLSRMTSPSGTRFVTVSQDPTLEALAHDFRHYIATDRVYNLSSRALGMIVSTPNRAANDAEYHEKVIPAYHAIRALAGKNDADVAAIVSHLRTALAAKGADGDDIDQKVNQLKWRASQA